MKEVEIISSGQSKAGFWTLLQNGKKEYAIFNRIDLLESGKLKIEPQTYKSVVWLEFETTYHLDLKIEDAKLGYNRNSKLDFGMYKGYELGVVYLFDAQYVIWCIDNIPEFIVEDLEELEQFGIMRYNFGYQPYRDYNIGNLTPLINHFETIQEAVNMVGMSFIKYSLPALTKEANSKKLQTFR